MSKFISFFIKKAIGLYINILSFTHPKSAARLAYKFFSEPRDGRLLKENLPGILQEANAEMITHNDLIFQAYTWQGNSHTILLIHGWESNTSRWEQLLYYLKSSGSTIIALDAPAHGLTSGSEFNIPRYAQFVDVMVSRFRPQVMIGHSLGGATALYYQSHFPNDSIKKMIILGAPCDLDTLLNNYRSMLGLNSKVFHMLKKHFLKHFRIRTKEFSGSLFASKIKIEGLLAHDKDDDIVSYREGEKIAKAWPGAEFVTTRGLGHSMHGEALYRKIYHYIFGHDFIASSQSKTSGENNNL